ncbi:MAG: sigma-54 dependent transcriptional regulator, partial [Thermodesulfobacteriota bacterium]|nr:sigma-54 dependent transcriptional regulator [Thermodesulfobacteriota bacterium]
SGNEALEALKEDPSYSIIILDVMMPEMDGLTTLQKIKEVIPDIPVIMLSALGEIKTVVEAMKLGASNYITKPLEGEELELAINNVLEKKELVEEIKDLKRQLEETRREEYFISVSEKMDSIKKMIEQIADTDVTVLIHGESGVGKEVIARSIYSSSPRRNQSFVKVSCAALPSELLESELFGYEKGAFTGAHMAKPGRFGLAHQGTIFLDEIGEMPLPLQAKLLQVLQDGVFTKLGAKEETHVDVRIIAATNKNLEVEAKNEKFREDLYYRLNVVNIYVPPLRERKEDIPVLCEYLLERYNKKYNRKKEFFSKNLLSVFMDYEWPGNIRELENIINRIVILEDESLVLSELTSVRDHGEHKKSLVSSHIHGSDDSAPLKKMSKKAMREVEKEMILKALSETNWNKKKAAEKLGISYKALLYKFKNI